MDQLGCFTEFDSFCQCYPAREDNLSEALTQAIQAQSGSEKKPKRILDIGSADGRLLRKFLGRLPAPPYSVVCLEPCSESFKRLSEWRGDAPSSITLHQQTLEAWLSQWSSAGFDCFDLIVCSHVHYHFEDPGAITKRMTDLLSPSGILVAIIDSHDSPLYQWFDSGSNLSKFNTTCRNGHYFGLEQFRASLLAHEVSHTAGTIDSKLLFRTTNAFEQAVAFLCRRDLTGKTSECHRPDWASSFPCEANWREGIVVVQK